MSLVPCLADQLHRFALLPDGCGLTDRELLECFLARREESAFTALVHRHGPMVLGVCRRMLKNCHDADDAFQATFLVLLHRAPSIRRPELLGNWLYGVACRTSLEVRAMSARHRRLGDRLQDKRDHSTCELPEAADWRPFFDLELNRLPEKYRIVVVLCDLEGLTRREAAQVAIAGRNCFRTIDDRSPHAGSPSKASWTGTFRWYARRFARPGHRVCQARAGSSHVQGHPAGRGKQSRGGPYRRSDENHALQQTQTPCLHRPPGVDARHRHRSDRPNSSDCRRLSVRNGDAPAPKSVDNKKAEPEPPRDKIFRIEGARWAVWSADRKVMAVWFGRSEKRKDGGEDDFDYWTTIKIYDAATGTEKVSLGEAKNNGAMYMALSPDGSVLALSTRLSIQKGDNIEIWDTKTGQPRTRSNWNTVGPGWRWPSRRMARRWRLPTAGRRRSSQAGSRLRRCENRQAAGDESRPQRFDRFGRLHVRWQAHGDRRRSARPADPFVGRSNRQRSPRYRRGPGRFLGLAFSPDGKLLAAADTQGGVRIWDTTNGVERAPLQTESDSRARSSHQPRRPLHRLRPIRRERQKAVGRSPPLGPRIRRSAPHR